MPPLKIFVLHYTKLAERKANILRQFQEQNITHFQFIEAFDRESLTSQQLNRFAPNLKPSEISLFLKHISVYQQMVKQDISEALLLEDDAILADNFLETLDKYRQQLPASWQMLFLGDGCGLHIPKNLQTPGQFIYQRGNQPTEWGGNGASKCTDSYMISKKCANLFMTCFSLTQQKIPYQIDHWINETARLLQETQIYWVEPTIVSQGSENNTFPKMCGTDIPLAYYGMLQ
jgi:GR25 family glycosyltransferase involved in LPS biosynthesis